MGGQWAAGADFAWKETLECTTVIISFTVWHDTLNLLKRIIISELWRIWSEQALVSASRRATISVSDCDVCMSCGKQVVQGGSVTHTEYSLSKYPLATVCSMKFPWFRNMPPNPSQTHKLWNGPLVPLKQRPRRCFITMSSANTSRADLFLPCGMQQCKAIELHRSRCAQPCPRLESHVPLLPQTQRRATFLQGKPIVLMVIAASITAYTALALTFPPDKLALQHWYKVNQGMKGSCLANTQWSNSSSDPCDDSWPGIGTARHVDGCSGTVGDVNRRVLALVLPKCTLSGTLASLFSVSECAQGTEVGKQAFGTMHGSPKLVQFSLKCSGLEQLQIVELGGNNFCGPIPDSIGRFRKLYVLDLGFNKLSGTIPSSIGQLAQMRLLALRTNLLTGPVPDT